MVLSDRSIREEIDQGRLVVDPPEDGCIQPSSVDLRLASAFGVFRVGILPRPRLDVGQPVEGFTELRSKHQGQTGSTASRGYQDFPQRRG